MRTVIRNPDALVSTDWLADHLDDPDLRVFDCSTVLQFEEGPIAYSIAQPSIKKVISPELAISTFRASFRKKTARSE